MEDVDTSIRSRQGGPEGARTGIGNDPAGVPMVMRLSSVAALCVALASWMPAAPALEQSTRPAPLRDHATWVDVRTVGVVGDGIADDTVAIQRAVALAPLGGVVILPAGRYRVTDAILVNRAVSLRGIGRGSQLLQATPGRDLLHLQG